MSAPDDMDARRRRHAVAVAAFAQRARMVSPAEGETPRGPGKWTPAQETTHVTLSYRAFASAITTGQTLRLRVPLERALEFQRTVLPRILAGGWFPRGATAPDEAVPLDPVTPLPLGVDELEIAAREFDDVVSATFAHDPAFRTTHPYFGPMLLPELLSLMAEHTEHHLRFLPGTDRQPVGRTAESNA
jgi:DinB superfamily